MKFLFLMSVIALIAYIPQWIWEDRRNWRLALRRGMGGGFVYTGIDHFANGAARYQPMIPDYLAPYDFHLVEITGGLELLAGIALLLPTLVYRRLGLPDLRPLAGVGLAMMLSVMVIANAHVAETGGAVAGLGGDAAYYALRPLFQPFIVLWALVASEAVWPRSQAA
ncbi:hypothetical protein ACFELO_10555 [Oceanicaulis sp. LC35]|uniref:DoxX family protein n=1 Tax=Oceanicaulis sp. LC35 TaxID=3349635 RepID=UPI003F863574